MRTAGMRHVGPPACAAGLLGLVLLPLLAALYGGALYARAVWALVWRR